MSVSPLGYNKVWHPTKHCKLTLNLKQSWGEPHESVFVLLLFSTGSIMSGNLVLLLSRCTHSFKDQRSLLQPLLLLLLSSLLFFSAFPTLSFNSPPPLHLPLYPCYPHCRSHVLFPSLLSSSPAPLFCPSPPLSPSPSYSMWLLLYSVTSFPHVWWSGSPPETWI